MIYFVYIIHNIPYAVSSGFRRSVKCFLLTKGEAHTRAHRSNRYNHPHKFRHIFARTYAYKFSPSLPPSPPPLPLVFPLWNNPPMYAVNAEYVTTFQANALPIATQCKYLYVANNWFIYFCLLFYFVADCFSILYSLTTSRIIKYVCMYVCMYQMRFEPFWG